MLNFYLPFNDPDLVHGAEHYYGDKRVWIHGEAAGGLSALGRTDTLYILAHGRMSTGSEITGTVKGRVFGTRKATMTAKALAKALADDGLPKEAGDVRLLVCWGGYVGGTVKDWKVGGITHDLNRKASEAPFAGQLCSALKDIGYFRMIVTGYRGTVGYSGTGNSTRLTKVMVSASGGVDLGVSEPLSRAFLDLGEGAGGTLTLDTESRTVWY